MNCGWYHVDVYSDTHGVPYGNFNMTDLVAKTGHSWLMPSSMTSDSTASAMERVSSSSGLSRLLSPLR